MGLAERRVAKQFQENEYEVFLQEIKTIVGKDVEVSVEWDSIAEDGMSHLYAECWPQVYFQPLLKALQSICADDMGKEAIADELQKVVIKNEGSISNSSKWSAFENKTLTLDHKPTTNVHDAEDRAKSLQVLLENSL